jgi:hypothetical protein
MNADSITDRINAALPNVKAGTLRMWGEWSGKPYDNVHSINRSSAVGSTLILGFDGGETLTIENPEGLEISDTVFSIRSVSASAYGREPLTINSRAAVPLSTRSQMWISTSPAFHHRLTRTQPNCCECP